jgi:hypothetical protein
MILPGDLPTGGTEAGNLISNNPEIEILPDTTN